nr:hypothetical protein [Tanacetum cinerariifolium]
DTKAMFCVLELELDGNEYSQKDKNKAKIDKTEHEMGEHEKSKSSQQSKSKSKVKNQQEKDKIGTKPDQIKEKREAWKSPALTKPITVKKERKMKKYKSKRDISEHLDTIPKTESDEVIKSSIEDLVLILIIKNQSFIAKIEALNANPTPSFDFVLKSPSSFPNSFLEKTDTSDNSLPESKIFCFDIEEKNSGSTTIHADIFLSDFDHFHFKIEPNPGKLTSIVDSEIRENVLSATNVNLSPEDDQPPLFAYVVWIFLPFLAYPIAPSYLLSSGNEDTIFDPGISKTGTSQNFDS